MIQINDSDRKTWEVRFKQMGVNLREIHGNDLDDWGDEDFYEEYHTILEA